MKAQGIQSLLWFDEPGYYSIWGGSINQLANGNVKLTPMRLAFKTFASQVQEVTQDASPQIVMANDNELFAEFTPFYRAYRVRRLLPGVSWTY